MNMTNMKIIVSFTELQKLYASGRVISSAYEQQKIIIHQQEQEIESLKQQLENKNGA